jgi:hypothetical protein
MNQLARSLRFAQCVLTAVGLTSLFTLGGCGGGSGGTPTTTSVATPATATDPRETSVTPTTTIRWGGGGFDGIGIAGMIQATDGGLWVIGAEGGLYGRPFLRKIEGTNPCGADRQRFLTEIYTRFDRRQGPTTLTPVRDGRFYAGFTGPGTVFVARFNEATCAVDATFGDQGVMGIPITGLVTVTNITLQRDSQGGVLVALSIPGQMLLRRLTDAGVWDGSFGINGLATNPNPDSFWLGSFAITPNGDILASGAVSIPFAFQPALLKFDAQGQTVSSFGTAGVQRYPQLSLGTGNAGSMLIEGDRVILGVATGSSVVVSDFNSNDSVVAAVDLQTGQLKAGFGTGGFLRWDWGYNSTEATGGWIPNGRGGYTGCGHVLKSLLLGQAVSLVDVTSNGQPDTTVGYQGRRLVAETNSANCAGLLRMADGRLAVAANDGGQAVVMFFAR